VSALLNTHAPPTEVTYRVRRSNAWFDDACQTAKTRARFLERQFQRTNLAADRAIWEESLKALHALCNTKRVDATMRSIKEAQGDSGDLWRVLDRTMGSETIRFEYVHMANDFADFFERKIATIRMETANAPPPVYMAAPAAILPNLDLVQPAHVMELIGSAPCKHSELDPLPTWLLKQCAHALAPYLTALFNLSIATVTFPSSMKRATVVPLLKKENLNADELKNYRPVSNLSFISKLLERIVSEQIMSYMERNELLPERQSAYRAGHSCETALLRIHSDLVAAADSGQISLIAMLDLSAAFDCVDHDILLERLSCNFGLDQPVTAWLRSYLAERTQLVKCHNDLSTIRVVHSGVPQGSVLGPLLFLLYTAELLKIIEAHGLSAHGYADDTQAYGSCLPSRTPALRSSMLRCIDDVTAWTASNRLKLNPDKTEFMWCATARMQHHIDPAPFVIGSASIEPQNKVQLLGVMLDSDLSMRSHVSRTVSSCFYQLRRLKSVRRSLPIEASKTLVSALVFSRCDNQNGLFAGIAQKQINRLQIILNASARLIFGASRTAHVTPLLRDKLHWLRFQQRITYKLCLTVYKALHCKSPAYIRGLLAPVKLNAATARLRSANRPESQVTLACPRVRRNYGECGFAVAGPSAWNNLTMNTRSAPTLELFKSRLKTELFLQSYS